MMNGEYIHVPTRNGEAPHTLADITKTKEKAVALAKQITLQ